MELRVILAIVAGVITAAAVWAILATRAFERERLARAMGIDRRPPARSVQVSPVAQAATLARVGTHVPQSVVSALGLGIVRLPRAIPNEELPRVLSVWRGAALLLSLAALAVAAVTRQPGWALLVPLSPLITRALLARYLRSIERGTALQMEREVPQALDVFVLALEAGLPFERAVTAYVETNANVLAHELATTVRELEVGYRRREALDRLVVRTHSPSLATIASSIRLAEEFGTPLAAALRSLVIDMRARRRQRLQEAALRAPVTMLLPTAGFILLPIFAIILGPIAIRVATGSLF